ncbi:MAG: response regulator [Spirochaetales bacterium]
MSIRYKFLLVDDEPIIREGIRDHIPWEDLGFQFLAACANGNEALEVLEKSPADVVMTDICMPFMDGLALARQIRDQYPSTKILLLTGYDEFEYAHQALKIGVHDYLMKPITPSSLRALLQTLREKLDEERKQFMDEQLLRRQLEESLPFLKERLLNRILSPDSTFQDIEGYVRFLELPIPLEGVQYSILVLEILTGNNPETSVLRNLSAGNAIRKILQPSCSWIEFRNARNQTVFLFWGPNAQGLYRETLWAAEVLEKQLPSYVQGAVHMGIGNPVSHITLVHRSYKEAMDALQMSILQGHRRVLLYRELTGNDSLPLPSVPHWGKELRKTLITGDRKSLVQILDRMKTFYRSSVKRVEEYRLSLSLTVAYLLQSAEELQFPVAEFFLDGSNPFLEAQECRTLEEMEEWFLGFCDRILEYFRTQQEDFSAQKAREGELFIQERYLDPGLSIGQACKELSVSTSYFSAIFKKHTGKTFLEYLTEVRMEKAKELLRTTSLRTYEIAEKVGYQDPHYFSLLFRKTVGITPTTYRSEGAHDLEE